VVKVFWSLVVERGIMHGVRFNVESAVPVHIKHSWSHSMCIFNIFPTVVPWF
jgi:hypothetical protein